MQEKTQPLVNSPLTLRSDRKDGETTLGSGKVARAQRKRAVFVFVVAALSLGLWPTLASGGADDAGGDLDEAAFIAHEPGHSAEQVRATAAQTGGGATVPDTVVVESGDVSAAVSTSPFGLSFRDRSGTDVLSSVPGGGAPTPTVHVSDLLGTVEDTDAIPPRYAPITFTVGDVSMTQHEQVPAVTGNPLLELSAGVTYSLTDVLSATRLDDGGVELRVATDDPTGRTAIVDVRPDLGDSVRTRVRFEPATGIALVGASFLSGPDEAFHGFGGRRNAVDQAGESFFNFIDQTVLDGPGTGGQPQTGWYQQAQFISSRPYGFFLEQSELSFWRMRSDRDDAWQVESNSPGLRFTVAPGGPAEAIGTLTAITGRTPVPPPWQIAPIFTQTLAAAGGKHDER